MIVFKRDFKLHKQSYSDTKGVYINKKDNKILYLCTERLREYFSIPNKTQEIYIQLHTTPQEESYTLGLVDNSRSDYATIIVNGKEVIFYPTTAYLIKVLLRKYKTLYVTIDVYY